MLHTGVGDRRSGPYPIIILLCRPVAWLEIVFRVSVRFVQAADAALNPHHRDMAIDTGILSALHHCACQFQNHVTEGTRIGRAIIAGMHDAIALIDRPV